MEAGQAAQQTDYKRNSKEVEHELLLGFTHRAVMQREQGGGKEENSTEQQWSKICCEHAILRSVESSLKKRLKSWFIISKVTPEHFIRRQKHQAISISKKTSRYRFLTVRVKLGLKPQNHHHQNFTQYRTKNMDKTYFLGSPDLPLSL